MPNNVNLLRKIRAPFHYDWCRKCTSVMVEEYRQLYMLPMMVGHYVSHKNADYYIQNLVKVDKKKDIPVGYYACGLYLYWCPTCDYRCIRLSIFLPVRDEEKQEEVLWFEEREFSSFLRDIY